MADGYFENQCGHDGGACCRICRQFRSKQSVWGGTFGSALKMANSGDIHGYELYTEVCSQLDLYFDGKLKQFDLPLKPVGTDFQKKVWRMLMTIPYGETRTYKEIAELAGNPQAFRAVGMANNNNPIAIIVPCHRVVGADGSLTGYAGGTDIKQWLLDHESAARTE